VTHSDLLGDEDTGKSFDWYDEARIRVNSKGVDKLPRTAASLLGNHNDTDLAKRRRGETGERLQARDMIKGRTQRIIHRMDDVARRISDTNNVRVMADLDAGEWRNNNEAVVSGFDGIPVNVCLHRLQEVELQPRHDRSAIVGPDCRALDDDLA
jgi:hypothetical protein